MEHKHEKWVCAQCGYTASGEFVGDICPECGLPYWKCMKCGFLTSASLPPDQCPGCKEKGTFVNVTSYTPDFGGPQNIDPRL
jgi:rubrerythrin